MALHSAIQTPPSQAPKAKICLYCLPPVAPYTKSSITNMPLKSRHITMLYHQQKKNDFIDRLVETSVEIIDSIWQQQEQCHSPYSKMLDYQEIKVVSTRAFIQEILRRSKTTYSNLQVCLFYLFRVKKSVVMHLNKIETLGETKSKDDHIIGCGRRMFLASLMLASKFLQDKNYRNRAWSRISGLALDEVNAAELAFLKLINYNLYISKATFDRWYSLLHSYLYREPSALTHPSSPCSLCYTNTRPLPPPPPPPTTTTRDTSPCMICCNQCTSTCRFHYPYHHSSCYYERFPSIKLAYPSPPADEMSSVAPSHIRYKRYNVDDDQDHLPIKRCCIEN